MINSPTKQAQPQYEITEHDKARQEAIARVWQAFDDDLPPSLIPMDNEDLELANAEDNITASSMRTIIRFLFGKELSITVEKNAPPEAQKAIDAVFGRKERRMPLLQKLAQNGLLSGQAFLRIIPSNYNKFAARDTDISFRLVPLDPATVFVQTVPGDCETVLLYCIEYCQHETISGKPTKRYYREEIKRLDPQQDDPDSQSIALDQDTTWEISHWTRIGDKGQWEAVGEPYTWPYSYCPVQTCQNTIRANSFWGDADTTQGLIHLNRNINLALSSLQKVNKLYSQPMPWITGARVPGVDVGAFMELPVEATVGVLDFKTDLANQIAFLKELHSTKERITSVPDITAGATQDMPNGPMSGIALETMCMALLNKVDDKHNTYGQLIIDTSKAIFQFMNMSPEIDVELGWQNPLPVNKKESWEVAVLQKASGVSQTTILRERGYDPDQEAELRREEATQQNVDFSRGQGLPPANQLPEEQEEDEE